MIFLRKDLRGPGKPRLPHSMAGWGLRRDSRHHLPGPSPGLLEEVWAPEERPVFESWLCRYVTQKNPSSSPGSRVLVHTEDPTDPRGYGRYE